MLAFIASLLLCVQAPVSTEPPPLSGTWQWEGFDGACIGRIALERISPRKYVCERFELDQETTEPVSRFFGEAVRNGDTLTIRWTPCHNPNAQAIVEKWMLIDGWLRCENMWWKAKRVP